MRDDNLTFPFQSLGNVLFHSGNINILLGFEIVIEHSRRSIHHVQNIPDGNSFIPFFSEKSRCNVYQFLPSDLRLFTVLFQAMHLLFIIS